MTLIGLLVIVIVLGLLLWLVESLPLAQPFKLAARVLLVLIAILYLLSAVGLLNSPTLRLR